MTDEEQLRQELRAATRMLPDPVPPPLDRVNARARVLKARRYAGLVAAAVATTAAIVVPLLAISGIGRDAGDMAIGLPPRAGHVPSELPDVGVVICDESGTRVATNPIRPQPDGVHFRTHNRTGRPLLFQIDSVGGSTAPPGVHDVDGGKPWSVAPGTVLVRCQALEEDAAAEGGFVSMTIEDPDGLWLPEVFGCLYVVGSESAGGGSEAGSERGDPLELAREHFAPLIRPGDEVRESRYPEAPDPTFGLVRDGKTFASVRFNRDGQGGWFVGSSATCSEPPQLDTSP